MAVAFRQFSCRVLKTVLVPDHWATHCLTTYMKLDCQLHPQEHNVLLLLTRPKSPSTTTAASFTIGEAANQEVLIQMHHEQSISSNSLNRVHHNLHYCLSFI